jgi:hypothetical protein
MHQTTIGDDGVQRGGFIWVRTGDHLVEAQWSPTAPAITPAPLPVSASDFALCAALARKLGIPVARLDKLDAAAVRAARLAAANASEFEDRFAGYTAAVEACR